MVVMALLEEGLVVLMIQVPMVVVQGEMALVLWVMQQQVIMEELVEWRLVVMPLLVEEVQAILMEQLVVVVALDMSLDLEEGEELMAQTERSRSGVSRCQASAPASSRCW